MSQSTKGWCHTGTLWLSDRSGAEGNSLSQGFRADGITVLSTGHVVSALPFTQSSDLIFRRKREEVVLFLPCAVSFGPALLRLSLSLGDRDLVVLSPPSKGDVKPNCCCCSAAVGRKPLLTRAAGRGCLSPQPPRETAAFWGEKRAFGKGDGILLGLSSTMCGETGGCLL